MLLVSGCKKHLVIGESSSIGDQLVSASAAVVPATSGDLCLTSLDLMYPVYVGTVFPIRKVLLNDGSVVGLNGVKCVNFMKFSLSVPTRLNLLNRNVVVNVYWEQNILVNGVAQSFKYDDRGFRCDYVPGSGLDPRDGVSTFRVFPGVPVPVLPVRTFPVRPGLPVFPVTPVPIELVRDPEHLQTVTFHLFSTLRYVFKAEIRLLALRELSSM